MGQTQNIEQQIQFLSNLQLGFGIAALLFLALAIFLFFYLFQSLFRTPVKFELHHINVSFCLQNHIDAPVRSMILRLDIKTK